MWALALCVAAASQPSNRVEPASAPAAAGVGAPLAVSAASLYNASAAPLGPVLRRRVVGSGLPAAGRAGDAPSMSANATGREPSAAEVEHLFRAMAHQLASRRRALGANITADQLLIRPRCACSCCQRQSPAPRLARAGRPFISMVSGENIYEQKEKGCGKEALFAFYRNVKPWVDAVNIVFPVVGSVPYIAVGNEIFPNTDWNIKWSKQIREQLGWGKNIERAGSTYGLSLIIPILVTLVWVWLFIFVQLPMGVLEILFWWILNPWWDLLFLTFFAIANALWQNCGMCVETACDKNKGKCACLSPENAKKSTSLLADITAKASSFIGRPEVLAPASVDPVSPESAAQHST